MRNCWEALGKGVPYGVCEVGGNRGWVSVGLDRYASGSPVKFSAIPVHSDSWLLTSAFHIL